MVADALVRLADETDVWILASRSGVPLLAIARRASATLRPQDALAGYGRQRRWQIDHTSADRRVTRMEHVISTTQIT
jgi:hypothetical protein